MIKIWITNLFGQDKSLQHMEEVYLLPILILCQDLDNEPVWTRQVPPAYGRGVPPADTDTLPSSEDEYNPRPQDGVSPQSEDQQHQCIFVKNTNGQGFVGLTPNQLQHIQISAAKTGTG